MVQYGGEGEEGSESKEVKVPDKMQAARGEGSSGVVWKKANVWEERWGVSCNHSNSDDVLLRQRQDVELSLTTVGAEQAKGTLKAGWSSDTKSKNQ